MEKLVEKIVSAGISISNKESIANGEEFNVKSSFKHNQGFFYIKFSAFEAIVLKSIYKDAYRIISGSDLSLHASDWTTIIKAINDIEDLRLGLLNLTLILYAGTVSIKKAVPLDNNYLPHTEMKTIDISKPFTLAESDIGSEYYLSENSIFSKSLISECLPEMLSPLNSSIFSSLPDILYPIFTMSGIKTETPSILNIFGSMYLNLSSYEKILKYIGLPNFHFRLHYLTTLSFKTKEKPVKIKRSLFPDTFIEINELLEELDSLSKTITIHHMNDDRISEIYAKIFIIYEILSIELIIVFASILKNTKDIDKILTLIYQTRKSNIFTSNKGLKVATYFDYLADIIEFNSSIDTDISKDLNILFKELNINYNFLSKKSIIRSINKLHSILDLRDSLLIHISNIICNLKISLEKNLAYLVKNRNLDSIEDIYYLDHSELKKCISKSFYSDMAKAASFKRAQYNRHASLFKPKELYYKDISSIDTINQYLYNKSTDYEYIEIYNICSKDIKGVVTTNLYENSYQDKILHFINLSVFDLNRYKDALAFITDSIPLFSPIVEYAILHNIPIYSGVRFFSGSLDGRSIAISSNRLVISSN